MAGWAILTHDEEIRAPFQSEQKERPRFQVRANLKRNDILFFEGDRATSLIHIHDGYVKLVKHGASGKDAIVGLYGPGEILGEIHLLDRQPYNATAMAMTPVVISREPYDKILSNAAHDPEIMKNLVRKLAERLRETQENMQFIATERVENRIANLLIKWSEEEKISGERTLRVPLMRQEVAEMVGATIETTIRILSKFIQDGAVRKNGRQLMIADLGYLQELADG